MKLVCQRRPSDRTEIVSILGENDSPEAFGGKDETIAKPTPDFVWPKGCDAVVIDTDDDWMQWVEDYGPANNIFWWTVG